MNRTLLGTAISLGLLTALPARAAVFGGVDFPDGAISFADVVVDYDPAFDGNTGPGIAVQDPSEALGPPDSSSHKSNLHSY